MTEAPPPVATPYPGHVFSVRGRSPHSMTPCSCVTEQAPSTEGPHWLNSYWQGTCSFQQTQKVLPVKGQRASLPTGRWGGMQTVLQGGLMGKQLPRTLVNTGRCQQYVRLYRLPEWVVTDHSSIPEDQGDQEVTSAHWPQLYTWGPGWPRGDQRSLTTALYLRTRVTKRWPVLTDHSSIPEDQGDQEVTSAHWPQLYTWGPGRPRGDQCSLTTALYLRTRATKRWPVLTDHSIPENRDDQCSLTTAYLRTEMTSVHWPQHTWEPRWPVFTDHSIPENRDDQCSLTTAYLRTEMTSVHWPQLHISEDQGDQEVTSAHWPQLYTWGPRWPVVSRGYLKTLLSSRVSRAGGWD